MNEFSMNTLMVLLVQARKARLPRVTYAGNTTRKVSKTNQVLSRKTSVTVASGIQASHIYSDASLSSQTGRKSFWQVPNDSRGV